MIQFKENMDRKMEEWMDGNYFIGPFWLSLRVQLGNVQVFNY